MGARSAGLGEGKMAQPLQTGEEGRAEKVGYFLSFRSAAMKLYKILHIGGILGHMYLHFSD